MAHSGKKGCVEGAVRVVVEAACKALEGSHSGRSCVLCGLHGSL